VILARSEAEACPLKSEYEEYSSAQGNLAMISAFLGMDLSKFDLDDVIEYVEINAIQTAIEAMTKNNKGKKVQVGDVAAFADVPGGSPSSSVCRNRFVMR